MKLSTLKPFASSRDLFFPFSNNALGSLFNDGVVPTQEFFKPGANILETETGFELHIALPGLKKEDVKIDLNENTLTISGERNLRKDDTKGTWHYSEIRQGKFSRSFVLPEGILHEAIEANFTDGILEIKLPKAEPKQAKTIEIK